MFNVNKMTKNSERYLIATVGEKTCAFSLSSLKEVIRIDEITFLKNAPEYIAGAGTYRGEVIPIVRLSYLLNESDSPVDMVIVLKTSTKLFGVAVTKTIGIREMKEVEFERKKGLLEEVSPHQIDKILTTNHEMCFLFDVAKIIGVKDWEDTNFSV